jgi:hypothetical protein
MSLQFSQMRFTLARTFMANLPAAARKKGKPSV